MDLILYAPEIMAKSKAMEYGKLLRLVEDGVIEVKDSKNEEEATTVENGDDDSKTEDGQLHDEL